MIINHNIPALNTYRQMGINQTDSQKAMEKLSSGLRINRAGDDAAGLAISEKMRAQIRGLDQASRNSLDSISLIQTAEGALNETQNILQRMRELATQAANDTNVNVDRDEIQKEINQLTSEINRIGNTTEFNTMTLLDGSRVENKVVSEAVMTSISTTKAISQTLDVGETPVSWTGTETAKFDVSFTGVADNGFDWANLDVSATNTLTITKGTAGLTVTFEGNESGTAGATLDITADAVAFDADTGSYIYNNHGISFTVSAEEYANWGDGATVTIDLTVANGGSGDVTGTPINTSADITALDDTTSAGGTAASISAGITVDATSDQLLADVDQLAIEWDGSNLIVTLSNGTAAVTATDFSWTGTSAFTYDANGITFELAANDSTAIGSTVFNLKTETVTEAVTVTAAVVEDHSLKFQIGANQNQALSIGLSDMRSEALGISKATGVGSDKQYVEISRAHDSLIEAGVMITGSAASTLGLDASKYYIEATFTSASDVNNGTNNAGVERALSMESHESARAAITVINDAIERVSGERSKLGATQNRLEHTIANLDNAAENLQAAESRIRDVDMAKEMMAFTKANILSQASQAMLAQANQAPQSVLQLLR